MKRVKLFFFSIIVFLSLAELVLRYSFGFCDALLYQYSNKYEYIPKPNQDRYRFGAHIYYNSYSQRNEEEPDSSRIKILGLGDSVLFGGTWMDQDSLATTLFNEETGMQMLNISAGSWGPDNCAAYLKEKGTFDAKAMILICSSHDAYDTMTFYPVVGEFPNYPDKQYKLAIIELLDRYLIPRIQYFYKKQKAKLDPDDSVVKAATEKYVAKKSDLFNPGLGQLKKIADSLNIPFGIYLHAEIGELKKGKYNDMGVEICEWAEENNVLLIKGLESGEETYMYKDIIHYNEKGQIHLANVLKMLTEKLLNDEN